MDNVTMDNQVGRLGLWSLGSKSESHLVRRKLVYSLHNWPKPAKARRCQVLSGENWSAAYTTIWPKPAKAPPLPLPPDGFAAAESTG